MKIRNAISKGWSAYRASLGSTLGYALIAAIVFLMPLVPLLCLLTKETDWFALIGVVLFVLVSLPARQNAAQALLNSVDGHGLAAANLIDGRNYGRKICSGLCTTACLLLWAAPGIALTVWCYLQYIGAADAVTIILKIRNLGGGDIMTGVLYGCLIYVATWIPLMIGLAFHSGTRYALAMGGRKLMKGKRASVMGAWFCSLIAIIPFIAALIAVFAAFLPGLKAALSVLDTAALSAQAKNLLLGILIDIIVLMLPAAPLRQMILAAFVKGKLGTEKKA